MIDVGRRRRVTVRRVLGMLLVVGGCAGGGGSGGGEVTEIAQLPVDTLTGIIARSNVALDSAVSVDGRGSLRVTTLGPMTVHLYEMGDVNVENARLIYQAKVRTQDMTGKVFLEMWCHFPGKGEFFSRGVMSAVTGTTDWTSQETPFFLQPGENPDNVKLNLVIEGAGTAWIDDIRLQRAPLG